MNGRPERFPDPKEFDVDKLPTAAHETKKTGIGRNDPCPCGSGKKFKRCHLGQLPAGKKLVRVSAA